MFSGRRVGTRLQSKINSANEHQPVYRENDGQKKTKTAPGDISENINAAFVDVKREAKLKDFQRCRSAPLLLRLSDKHTDSVSAT